MFQCIMRLLFDIRVTAIAYIHLIRLQEFCNKADNVRVRYFLGKRVKQSLVGQVVKVLAKIHHENVAICAVMPVEFSQVLFQSPPGEGYALTFKTCAVVMYETRAQYGQKHIFTEAVLHNSFPWQHRTNVAHMASFVQREGLTKFFLPCPCPQFLLHSACFLEQVQSVLLGTAFPAAGFCSLAVACYKVICR